MSMAARFAMCLRKCLTLLAASSVFVMPSAWAQSFTLNLQDAEIQTLITTVSEVTGKNFIVDPRVKGKVTVISARPLRDDEVVEEPPPPGSESESGYGYGRGEYVAPPSAPM